jgi:hypothetical protein
MPGTTVTRTKKPVKQKRSFTLSRSSVQFLERLRRKTAATSTSLVLDQLIRDAEQKEAQAGLEASIAAYYSQLSREEQAEQELWGAFASEQ